MGLASPFPSFTTPRFVEATSIIVDTRIKMDATIAALLISTRAHLTLEIEKPMRCKSNEALLIVGLAGIGTCVSQFVAASGTFLSMATIAGLAAFSLILAAGSIVQLHPANRYEEVRVAFIGLGSSRTKNTLRPPEHIERKV
jgi:hypothetical protein